MVNIIRFGIELEGFIKKFDDGLFYKIHDINSSLPRDAHPYTFEIRTEPHENISNLFTELRSKIDFYSNLLDTAGYELMFTPSILGIPYESSRKHIKARKPVPNNFKNSIANASLQVNISINRSIRRIKEIEDYYESLLLTDESGKEAHYKNLTVINEFKTMSFSEATINLLLNSFDKEFENEIKHSLRKESLYYLKPGNIFEYRSLPCNIELSKLETFLTNIKQPLVEL